MLNSEVLKSYFEQSELSLAYMEEKVSPNFLKFLTGEKQPSYQQLVKIAKQFDIPVGLLLLNKPVAEPTAKLKFRTINSEYLAKQSPELRDTILEMQDKQDFLKEEIDTSLDFVGKFSTKSNYFEVANYIKQKLGLGNFPYLKKGNYFKFLRSKVDQLGVFVFLNGKVKDNSHRTLNVDEFRGFVLVDKEVPIIFINQRDSKNGQVFTLIHELVHLFIGESEILGTQSTERDYDKTEAFVNKVTAEILVPNSVFREMVDQQGQDLDLLAKYFRVSKFVVVRRLKDNHYISAKDYNRLVSELNLELTRYVQKKSSGGNYHNNLNYRIDHNFFKYVEGALNNQKISYTDAFNLVGVGYKGYQALKESR